MPDHRPSLRWRSHIMGNHLTCIRRSLTSSLASPLSPQPRTASASWNKSGGLQTRGEVKSKRPWRSPGQMLTRSKKQQETCRGLL
jgi:hypothetical protein